MNLTFGAQTGTTAVKRKPQFVSPNATTASISINSGTAQSFDVSASSTLCQTVSNVRTCALPLTAPYGQDSIAVSLMGTSSVNGNQVLLGQGSNSLTVVAGTNFTVAVGINPVVAGINVGQGNVPAPTAYAFGSASSQSATLTFADPSGANITGSGNVPNFLTPVTLTSSDPHVTITPTSLITPGQGFTIAYDGSTAVAQTVTVSAGVGTFQLATATFAFPGLNITRYNLGAQFTIDPEGLTVGSDGNIWAALSAVNEIARIIPGDAPTAPGAVTLFPTGIAGGHPVGIASGADGLIYYSDNNSCTIGRMNTSGVQQGGLALVAGGGCNLWGLGTDGAAGNIWFIDSSHDEVGYIGEASWPSPGSFCGTLPGFAFSISQTITLGSDGAMWFTMNGVAHSIGRYAGVGACLSQTLQQYVVPSAGTGDVGGLALGSDGNLWFPVLTPDFYAKITPAGVITEYPNIINPNDFANPDWIAAGPASNGELWIPQGGGAVSFLPATPTTANVQLFVSGGQEGQTNMRSAILGPDNNIWFSGQGSNPGNGFVQTQDEVSKFTPR
jgi:streptogramin lyase